MRTSLDSPLDNHVYHYGRELELIEDSGFLLFLFDNELSCCYNAIFKG